MGGATRLVFGAHNTFHKGHVEVVHASNYVADIMPAVQNAAGPENTLFRSSGGIYEIQTDVDGDPTEFVCDNSGLRTSYIASSAGYVSRSEPQTVRFVDASYGSSQPALKPLSVFGGTPAGSPSALTAGGVLCAETLTADAHSSSDAIAVNEPVEIQIGGATTSCYATDMRAIRFQSGNPATQSSVKIATINNANRQVTHATNTNPLVEYGDISVGDRVMLA